MCVCEVASVVSDSATIWTVAHQAPLSVRFSRQEYRSGLLCLSPGYLPNLGIEPSSFMSPALVVGFFTTGATWEANMYIYIHSVCIIQWGLMCVHYVCMYIFVCIYIKYIWIYVQNATTTEIIWKFLKKLKIEVPKKIKSKMQQFHFCLLTQKIKISISERKKIIFCFSRLTLSPHRCCQKEVKVRVPSSASVAGLGSREVHVCA